MLTVKLTVRKTQTLPQSAIALQYQSDRSLKLSSQDVSRALCSDWVDLDIIGIVPERVLILLFKAYRSFPRHT